jgi:exportin-2 (importin alpha re-exporter)
MFEQALFGPFTIIIQQDIDRKPSLYLFTQLPTQTHPITEYILYIFQVLAQMLELHISSVPPAFPTSSPQQYGNKKEVYWG